MIQRIGKISLNKNLSTGRLSKVGAISFRGKGVQSGTRLKDTLVGIGVGKSERQFDEALKKQGARLDRRKKVLELAYDTYKEPPIEGKKFMTDKGSMVLTDRQIRRNLTDRQAQSGIAIKRGSYRVSTAGPATRATTAGAIQNRSVVGASEIGSDMTKLGLKKPVGSFVSDKPINNSLPTGIKPIGL